MIAGKPFKKAVFDTLLAATMILVLLPTLVVCAVGILFSAGRPIFYRSVRRVHGRQSMTVVKFRTMRNGADTLLNRDTVPVDQACFLNIPSDSLAYTPVGRIIERCMLTEMPQLMHVLTGRMSIVGNRPLPENVIAALKVANPAVESRFAAPAGLTGPVQLIGRDFISDADRLRVEIAYCERVLTAYSILLDLKLLGYTVLVGILPRFRLSPDAVVTMLSRPVIHEAASARPIDPAGAAVRR